MIRSFPSEDWQDHFVHAGDIDVAACEDGKLVQTLPIMAWQKINFGATFRAYGGGFTIRLLENSFKRIGEGIE